MPMKSALPFDRYDVPSTLKGASRDKTQGGQPGVVYHRTYSKSTTETTTIPYKDKVDE